MEATLRRGSSPGPLSQAGFDRLLELLDSDRDQAGLKYETLRRKLLRFFEWRGCHPAEDLADETLDRVSRKLAEGVEIRLPDPSAYVYGVARNIAREASTRATRLPPPSALSAAAERVADPATVGAPAEDAGRALDCLDRCLEALPVETRQLLLLYHAGGKREGLLDGLRIPAGPLYVRMHRLRKRLERCVLDCLDSNRPSGKEGGPGRHSSMKGGDER